MKDFAAAWPREFALSLGSPAGAPFTPASISWQVALMADRDVYEDTALTDPVENADFVRGWKSGFGATNDATNAETPGTTTIPTYAASDAIFGGPCITFDGGDLLTLGSAITDADLEIFAVVSPTSLTNCWILGASGASLNYLTITATTMVIAFTNGNTASGATALAINTRYVLNVSRTGTTVRMWINGVELTVTGTSVSNWAGVDQIGKRGAIANATMKAEALFIRNAALTDAQRASMYAFLV